MSEASQRENPSVSLSVQQRVDEVCVRFEDAWRAGQRPRIEDFLGEVSEPEHSFLLRQLLKMELDYRHLGGNGPAWRTTASASRR
jgi:hypothetical protein